MCLKNYICLVLMISVSLSAAFCNNPDEIEYGESKITALDSKDGSDRWKGKVSREYIDVVALRNGANEVVLYGRDPCFKDDFYLSINVETGEYIETLKPEEVDTGMENPCLNMDLNGLTDVVYLQNICVGFDAAQNKWAAFQTDTGEELWRCSIVTDKLYAAGPYLVALLNKESVHSISRVDLHSGDLKWTYTQKEKMSLAGGDKNIIAAYDTNAFAMQAEDGKKIWRSEDRVHSAKMLGNTIYAFWQYWPSTCTQPLN